MLNSYGVRRGYLVQGSAANVQLLTDLTERDAMVHADPGGVERL